MQTTNTIYLELKLKLMLFQVFRLFLRGNYCFQNHNIIIKLGLGVGEQDCQERQRDGVKEGQEQKTCYENLCCNYNSLTWYILFIIMMLDRL